MANRHFGNFADVWKHLVLDEVLVKVAPARYAETHAGSAAYPMVDDAERRFGILGFLDRPGASSGLASSSFQQVAPDFVTGKPSLYPGSALQAMVLLGDECTYLRDLDPVSVDDLRTWASRLRLTNCKRAAMPPRTRDFCQALTLVFAMTAAPSSCHEPAPQVRARFAARWPLFDVAVRACQSRPEQRYRSLPDFCTAWRAARERGNVSQVPRASPDG